jgi:hypothetical protein
VFTSLQELEKKIDTKKIILPNEPPLGDEKVITIVVRMPDGGRCERRFFKTDKLQVKTLLESECCNVDKISSKWFLFLLLHT